MHPIRGNTLYKSIKEKKKTRNKINIIFSDATYKAKEGNASFGYIMKLNNAIVDAGALRGPKVTSSKKGRGKWFWKGS